MALRIRATDAPMKVLRDASAPLPCVAPGLVESALGAVATEENLAGTLAPITLFHVRSELLARLQSSGGRPALSGTSRRVKIPLADREWADLEELAALVTGVGFKPSAGQIASVLLAISVQSVVAQVARSPEFASSPLGRELAARSAVTPSI